NQARITRRPFNINYSPAYPYPYHPGPPPGVYPGNRQPANDEPAATGQDGSSRVVDDQNQGQSTLGYGYDSPQFNYRPPYPDGFYPGYPGFYPRPFNDTNPVDPRNGSGPYPFGPPFYDPKFGPYFPYQQPYPNFPGKSGQNGNQEQADAQQN
ncbi:programmed cell death 6-interacting protein-like, partial [Ceratina calcarata]|uniref:Programmed cell death 6-interacting protein-like n=1 Tax=Ceratina calcarata TaxID=156304 RepID=A0AAJ7S340_9HYME